MPTLTINNIIIIIRLFRRFLVIGWPTRVTSWKSFRIMASNLDSARIKSRFSYFFPHTRKCFMYFTGTIHSTLFWHGLKFLMDLKRTNTYPSTPPKFYFYPFAPCASTISYKKKKKNDTSGDSNDFRNLHYVYHDPIDTGFAWRFIFFNRRTISITVSGKFFTLDVKQ